MKKDVIRFFSKQLAVGMLILFGFPTLFQFWHTASKHILPHCHDACRQASPAASNGLLYWEKALAADESCPLQDFKLSVKELPELVMLSRKVFLFFRAIMFSNQFELFESFSFFSTPRAPPLILN